MVESKVIDALEEYKISILDKIEYDFRSNKIKFKDSINLSIKSIISDLKLKFGDDLITKLNIEPFFRKINQILLIKKRNTKRRIREEFKIYYESIDKRIFGDEISPIEKEHGEESIISRKKYESEKYEIQIELLKLQEWVVKHNKRVAIVFEGRDAAGKGSTIKRFVEYLNPKHYRVVALGIPTENEKNNWFKRYERHLPKNGEIVFFDRSWYNRAVVEPAMGYCTEFQYKHFMDNVLEWEENLISNGMILIKFWFSISKEKQQKRFQIRQSSPLKYWKFSPNDAKVIDKFDLIGQFKNEMFISTSSNKSPWICIDSNDKKIGRLNAIRYVLDAIPYSGKDESKCIWYPEVVTAIR